VKVTESSTGRVLVDTTTPDTSVTVAQIDPGLQYVAKVTPINSFGGCFTSSQVLRAGKPSPPHGLAAARTDLPSTIRLSWKTPTWAGYGSITHYRVYYGDSIVSKTIDVTENEVTIEGFNPEKDSKFQVVAYDGELRGEPSTSFTLLRIGAAGEKELDPLVRITESDGFIRATIEGPVGSSSTYPDLFLDVNPAAPSSTYTEHHQIANRATALTFDTVPCGVFTVTVSGQGEAGSKEFGRVLVNRCQVGQLDKTLWRLVYGKAAITGNMVDMNNGSETRVISQKPMTQPDMALTTKATLRSGWGYGVWLRAHLPTNANNASVSGYTMQYDPGYGRINSFGPALLLRVWDTGKECSTPLARVKWPTGLEVNTQHLITAVVQGDALWMSIDGVRLFAVPSLTAAMGSSGCAAAGFKEPSGNQIGFRAWGSGTSAVFEESTLN
jgi:Fibronectin type III domain